MVQRERKEVMNQGVKMYVCESKYMCANGAWKYRAML